MEKKKKNLFEKKKGFTLAEVLITLGIIGVVAAITIPALITNIGERQKERRIENIKNKLRQATDSIMIQSHINGWASTEAFVQELSKHMKILDVCDTTKGIEKCWPYEKIRVGDEDVEVKTLKTASAFGLDDKWGNPVAFTTGDGTPFIISYNLKCAIEDGGLTTATGTRVNSTACISGIFDWNGGSAPNSFGTDKPDVISMGEVTAVGKKACSGTKVDGFSGFSCVSQVLSPGIDFQPIDTCDGTNKWDKNFTSANGHDSHCRNNYWAGLQEACDKRGMRIPTIHELRAIYNKKAELGLPSEYFWASTEVDSGHAEFVRFEDNYQFSCGKSFEFYGLCVNGVGNNPGISYDCGSYDSGTYDCGSYSCGSYDCGSYTCGSYSCGSYNCGAYDCGAYNC